MVIIDDQDPNNPESNDSFMFMDWIQNKAGDSLPQQIIELKEKNYDDDSEKSKAYSEMCTQIEFYYQLGLINEADCKSYLDQVKLHDTD